MVCACADPVPRLQLLPRSSAHARPEYRYPMRLPPSLLAVGRLMNED